MAHFASLAFSALLVAISPAGAHPSGGPYGPVQQTYTAPRDAAHVYYVSPDGQAGSPATVADPATLESVFPKIVTGDVIVLRGGTYRTGNLIVNQGVTLQPYADERPVIKGTQIAANWEPLSNNVWRTSWTNLFPAKPQSWWRREREGMKTPLHRFNNDMVFVDGRALQSAGWEGELNADNYSIDYEDGYVFLGFNPAGHVIEITCHDSAIVRTIGKVHGKKSDGKGLVIRGITFTQFAYRALEVEGHEPDALADPATFGKDVVGSTFENVTISYCSRVAGYFRGDKTVFRNCLISDTSTEGIYIIASSDCLLERNIFARNNIEHITGYFPSAVKIFNQTRRVVCRDNVVMDQPESNGIWYDVGNHDGVFVDNWVEGCVDGFFYEISWDAVCAGNVFINCDAGVRALNSANVHVYQNTFVNSVASFERTERSAIGDHFGWHPTTGPDVDQRNGHIFVGNLLTAGEGFRKPLLRVQQTSVLCGKLTNSPMSHLNDNVYVRSGNLDQQSLLAWGPVDGTNCMVELKNLDDLRQLHPEFETHGLYLSNYSGSVFKSPELKNYQLNASFNHPGVEPLPAEVQKLLGDPASRGPGAY